MIRKPKVYIAGPIKGSGDQASNMARALQAANMLTEAGCIPFIPNLWFTWEMQRQYMGLDTSHDFWMDID